MKSITAIALIANLPPSQIISAGIFVSTTTLTLTLTGLIVRLNNIIPKSLISGIQLGTGLALIQNGIKTIQSSKLEIITDNYIISLISIILVLFTWNNKRSVTALILFIIGVIISISQLNLNNIEKPRFAHFNSPFIPGWDDFLNGVWKAGLGQVPLTILNSVIAVHQLANDLYPLKKMASIRDVGLFVGLMNLASAWFGSVPYCCGSGGLAGQYRFGARSGLSVIILGVVKIMAGLLFGDSMVLVFEKIPKSIIGVMLSVAGLQLCLITRKTKEFKSDREADDAYFVMLITGVTSLGFANIGIGFLFGVATVLIFTLTGKGLDVNNEETVLEEGESTHIEAIQVVQSC
jgi:MFS superfamily sulfate permease-like transporter